MLGLKQVKEEPDENGFRKCETECEFGKNCEEFGSTNTYHKLIRKEKSEKYTEKGEKTL